MFDDSCCCSTKVDVTMACECEKFKQTNLIKQVLDRSTCLFHDVTCLDNDTERHCIAHDRACVTKLHFCFVAINEFRLTRYRLT